VPGESGAADFAHKKTPRIARRFLVGPKGPSYFETERLNIRSIFSLVAWSAD
jgi:hypothetical protein